MLFQIGVVLLAAMIAAVSGVNLSHIYY